MGGVEPTRLQSAPIGRHYHARPYATLIVEGGYEEAGDQGRYRVEEGDLLLHPAFSAHHDLVGSKRTYVLDLPLPFDGRAWPGIASVAGPEDIIRSARRDLREAVELLVESLEKVRHEQVDPADRLAEDVTADPSLRIGDWATTNGHSREWLSRRFRRLYGIDCAVFRAEARSRNAWRRIVDTCEPLAEIAAECGFADQAHMTRSVGRLTGRSPKAWRSAVTSIQEAGAQAR